MRTYDSSVAAHSCHGANNEHGHVGHSSQLRRQSQRWDHLRNRAIISVSIYDKEPQARFQLTTISWGASAAAATPALSHHCNFCQARRCAGRQPGVALQLGDMKRGARAPTTKRASGCSPYTMPVARVQKLLRPLRSSGSFWGSSAGAMLASPSGTPGRLPCGPATAAAASACVGPHGRAGVTAA